MTNDKVLKGVSDALEQECEAWIQPDKGVTVSVTHDAQWEYYEPDNTSGLRDMAAIEGMYASCSACGHVMKVNGQDKTHKCLIHYVVYKYCPDCGRRMVKKDDKD